MIQKKFSTSWNASTQRRKQRKFRYNAPLHVRGKFVHVHLSPALRTKYGTRNVQLRKGDKVRILRGQFKKQEGKVERVNLKRELVFVTGIETVKLDGNKIAAPLKPSNLMIIEVDTTDAKRKHKLTKETPAATLAKPKPKSAEKSIEKKTEKKESQK